MVRPPLPACRPRASAARPASTRRSRAAAALALGLALLAARTAAAQAPAHHDEHDEDHEHGHLHFSHPLVTESPSPDTKLRVDHLWSRSGEPGVRLTERQVRVEGEYAFGPGLSLAVTLPYAWRSGAGAPGAHGLGNTELSLKTASLRWGERGLLVGGGLAAGLPTGSDARGIGTSRAVELEPFVDAGWKREGLELVGFARYGTTVRNREGAEAERELAFDGSALYPVSHAVEALVELGAERALGGEEHATATTLAPGVKLYPFANRALMMGVSAPLGLGGEARHARGVLVSGFYHF